jgi:hypothetical protein
MKLKRHSSSNNHGRPLLLNRNQRFNSPSGLSSDLRPPRQPSKGLQSQVVMTLQPLPLVMLRATPQHSSAPGPRSCSGSSCLKMPRSHLRT